MQDSTDSQVEEETNTYTALRSSELEQQGQDLAQSLGVQESDGPFEFGNLGCMVLWVSAVGLLLHRGR